MGFSFFLVTQKQKQISVTSTPVRTGKAPAMQEATHGLEALYLLQQATLKREFITDLISGDTTILRDRSPWFCLVIEFDKEGDGKWKTGSERKKIILKQFGAAEPRI